MSELFNDVFDSGCGGCIRTCECGIVHFDSYNNWDWEEDELKTLQRNAKEEPKLFIEHDHAIGTISIGGVEIVQGCPCNLAQNYENSIIEDGVRIAEFLNKRAEMLKAHANLIEVK